MFKFEFNERTSLLPILDAYLCTQFENIKSVLEIGVYKGGYLFNIIGNNPKVLAVGIDPFPNLQDIKKNFLKERDSRGYEKSIFLYSSFEEFCESEHKKITFDLIHCDGEHSEFQVIQDLKNALPLLNEKGILVIDDIFYHSYPGVTSAAFSFINEFKLSPFLFTQKKIYVCKSTYYEYYYKKAALILKKANVNFEESEKFYSVNSYPQSNSIFGYNLIITSDNQSRNDSKKFLKTLNLKMPFKSRAKILIKAYLPPALLELFIWFKSK